MPLRLTAHLPDQAARSLLLREGEVLLIGRGEGCTLRLDHPSISRRHAELDKVDQAWRLRDLGSKNGSHFDGKPVSEACLTGSGWLRLGDLYCEFEQVDASVGADDEARLQARRARATALTVGLQKATGFSELLEGSLHAVIELAQCQRGFLLLRDGDGHAVRAQHAIDPEQMSARAFSGSAGAVERVLHEGRPVVVNDIGDAAWLASRDSVVAAKLRSLVCMPLLDGDHPIGAIYADRTSPGTAITDLDLGLLEAFAERAALYIVARQASDALGGGARARWEAVPRPGGPAP